MNKNQWTEKIKEILEAGSSFCELAWNSEEWNGWNNGEFTTDQRAMLDACQSLSVEPRPGERSPDTISFWRIKNPAAVALGKLGGAKTSAAKAISSAANGRLGGRPRKQAAEPEPENCLECGAELSSGHYLICSQSES